MSEKEKDLADHADRDDSPQADADDNDDAPAAGSAEVDESEEPGEDAPDDGASARVADALGVGEGEGDAAPGEGEAEAKAEEDAGPANRAARRREEALERRRKRKAGGADKAAEGLPRDKNKRAKELLMRRKEAAVEQRPAQLEASEMVDDALSRMWASTTKWVRGNLATIQYVAFAGVVGLGAFVGYNYFTEKTLGAASGLLAAAAEAEDGYILPEDKRPDEDKELDPTPTFKTLDERSERVLASYREVSEKHPGSGAAILAKLGEAGALLDKREFDKAVEGFEAVLKTPLAAADLDVKARSIEGVGLAKEGKGDVDGAMASYKQLEQVDARGFKELAQFHQARLLLAKNTEEDRTKAKDLLKTAYDKLKAPSLDAKPFPYLEKSIEQALRSIDPSLVPDKETLNSVRGGQMAPEDIQARLRKIQEELGKKAGDGDGH